MKLLDVVYSVAGRVIDPLAGTVSFKGSIKHIRRKSLEVLALLADASCAQVSRYDLIDALWNGSHAVGEGALHVVIHELRRLLEDCDPHKPLLRTVPRRGYMLCAEVIVLSGPDGMQRFATGMSIGGVRGWILERLLGRGKWSEVWHVRREGEPAPKAMRICCSEKQLRSLKREVSLLRVIGRKLDRRADVLMVEQWQLANPPYYMTMPLARGGNVADWARALVAEPALAMEQRRTLSAQIASALAAVHGAGISHGHLVATSVLMDTDAEGRTFARLGGFGQGGVPDRSVLAGLPITLTGLTQDGGGGSEADPMAADIRDMATLAIQLCVGELGASVPADWELRLPGDHLRVLLRRALGPAADRPCAAQLASALQWVSPAQARSDLAAAAPASTAQEPPPIPSAFVGDATSAPEESAFGATTMTPAPLVPSFGSYRLLEKIGEGGMGLVYLAEQASPLMRKVALKVMRQEGDARLLLTRFQTERQTLALMNHPNIAAVYDVGTTPAGQPYFAMEYVPGQDIAGHCNQRKLDVRARVSLFLQVCSGMFHAHQRGIIHRDLKPGNILVRVAQGQTASVKIIDFGVAKFLQGPLGGDTATTRVGGMVGTPLYCSPEQADAGTGEVDTRSDVYALGVVLYELLVGATPYEAQALKGLSSSDLRDKLVRTPVPDLHTRFAKLSATDQAAVADQRMVAARTLQAQLSSDLSWVVLRCLRADPEERYASVLDLERDLRRWLEGAPVEARRITWRYRWRKLFRRHRALILASTGAVLLLLLATALAIVGFVQSNRSARHAEIAAQEAQRAVAFQQQQSQRMDVSGMALGLRADLQEELARIARSDPSLLQGTKRAQQIFAAIDFVALSRRRLELNYLRPLVDAAQRDYEDAPALRAAVLQGVAITARELGMLQWSGEVQEEALQLQRRVLGDLHPDTLEALHQRGLLRMAEQAYGRAASDLRASYAGFERTLGSAHARTLGVAMALADVQVRLDKPEALDFARTNHEVHRQSLGADDPCTLDAQRLLGLALTGARQMQPAQSTLEHALAVAQANGGEDRLLVARLDLALADHHYARRQNLQSLRHQEAGWRLLRDALGEHHLQTLDAARDLAMMYRVVGRLDEGERVLRPMLEALKAAYGTDHPLVGASEHTLSTIIKSRGQVRESLALMREVRDRIDRHGGGNEFTHRWLMQSGMVDDLVTLGQFDEAERLAHELLDGDSTPSGVWGRALVREDLARIQQSRGNASAAVVTMREAVRSAAAADVIGVGNADVIRSGLGEALWSDGQLDAARALLETVVARQQEREGDAPVRVPVTRGRLAAVLLAQGHPQAALAVSGEALAGACAVMHPGDPRLAWLHTIDAQVQLANGVPRAALQSFSAAWQSIRTSGLGPYYLQPLRRSCAGLQAAGLLSDELAPACAVAAPPHQDRP